MLNILELEQESTVKKSMFSDLKLYSKEVKFSFFLGFTISLAFYRILYGYSLIIMTKNFDDKDELRISRGVLVFCIVVQIIA